MEDSAESIPTYDSHAFLQIRSLGSKKNLLEHSKESLDGKDLQGSDTEREDLHGKDLQGSNDQNEEHNDRHKKHKEPKDKEEEKVPHVDIMNMGGESKQVE
jgi:hypothetical protein